MTNPTQPETTPTSETAEALPSFTVGGIEYEPAKFSPLGTVALKASDLAALLAALPQGRFAALLSGLPIECRANVAGALGMSAGLVDDTAKRLLELLRTGGETAEEHMAREPNKRIMMPGGGPRRAGGPRDGDEGLTPPVPGVVGAQCPGCGGKGTAGALGLIENGLCPACHGTGQPQPSPAVDRPSATGALRCDACGAQPAGVERNHPCPFGDCGGTIRVSSPVQHVVAKCPGCGRDRTATGTFTPMAGQVLCAMCGMPTANPSPAGSVGSVETATREDAGGCPTGGTVLESTQQAAPVGRADDEEGVLDFYILCHKDAGYFTAWNDLSPSERTAWEAALAAGSASSVEAAHWLAGTHPMIKAGGKYTAQERVAKAETCLGIPDGEESATWASDEMASSVSRERVRECADRAAEILTWVRATNGVPAAQLDKLESDLRRLCASGKDSDGGPPRRG